MPTSTWGRIVAGLIVGSLAIGTVYLAFTGHFRAVREAVQAQANNTSTQAAQEAAKDAIHIVVDTQAAHGRIDLVTQGNADAIRNATGATAPVDPAVHAAGLRALCLHDAYRGLPACQLVPVSGASEPEGQDTGSPAAH